MTKEKYKGYGYHGGGRKPSPPGQARRTTVSICGTAAEIATLRDKASEAGKSISRLVIDTVCYSESKGE